MLPKTIKWVDFALRIELEKCATQSFSFQYPGSSMEDRFHNTPVSMERALNQSPSGIETLAKRIIFVRKIEKTHDKK